MITVYVKLWAKAGCEDALRDGARTPVAATQQEPGSVQYHAYVANADPAQLIFFEVWQDEAAREAHGQTPHLREFFALSKSLLARRPEFDEVTAL